MTLNPMNEIDSSPPRVSVLMPIFGQSHFEQAPLIACALDSLCAQSLRDWELIVIVDGAPDAVFQVIEPYQSEHHFVSARIQAPRMGENRGLCAALNLGLESARADFIAYLPCDDLYDPDHLKTLVSALENSRCPLAFSGARHHANQTADGQIPDFPLQLVQVLHRATCERWTTRDDLTTDDLHRLFWSKFLGHGEFIGTGAATCEWRDHPHQRHKVIREDLSGPGPYLNSGVNAYRARYHAAQPLRFHASTGNLVDEIGLFQKFRERPSTPRAQDGLKILLAGELAFNPERVLALEERGHKLYGLWMPNPGAFNYVGPMPFGHVEDIARENWRERVEEIQPDVIYALLNWRAMPFAHQILMNNPGVPFVWHIKESPIHCRDNGTWNQLVDLHTRADGQIFSSAETRDWFFHFVPQARSVPSMVLDGDLPKRDWLDAAPTPRLSQSDGEIHTVLAGRPLGIAPELIGELARRGVHFHVYGEMKGGWAHWLDLSKKMGGSFLHQHGIVAPDQWVEEFSRYDAAWLHPFKSENGGDLAKATWDDLNYPARLATYSAAGLPTIQPDNSDSIFATDALARRHDTGVFYRDIEHLCAQMRDADRMNQLRDNVWNHREEFTFDFHADELISFFRQAMRYSD